MKQSYPSLPFSDVNILGLNIRAQTFETAINTLLMWLESSEKYYVSTCTVATLIQAMDSKEVHESLDKANMVTSDGMPLVWQQKKAGCNYAERVYGPDILHALCQQTQYQPTKHFFYGGWQHVTPRMIESLTSMYPDLTISGFLSPDKIDIASEPKQETIDYINRFDSDIIWVGLGSPKQDLWMYKYRPYLNAKLLIGIGAAFDFIAHVKPQAPLWMQQHGLEWAFRLITEPRRLWKRYLIYNSRFILETTRQSSYIIKSQS